MKKQFNQFLSIVLLSGLLLFAFCGAANSRTVMQLMPTLTISEDYTDNYFQTDTDEREEFITSIGLGFSLGFLNPKSKIYLSYNPEYKKYKNFDDRDRLEHIIGLDGNFTPTKFTNINANIAYTANTDDLSGEYYEQSAFIGGSTQLTKNTSIDYSNSFTRSFDQQQRTGDFKEHDVNATIFGLTNQFGDKSRRGFNISYEFDSYDEQDADEYTKIKPSGFYTYYFNPLNALEFNAQYENTDYDNSDDDIETYSGHIRYIKSISRHLDAWAKYRHSYSDRDTGDHTIYHPSVGVDWQVTKDSGISVGAGVLINEWDNENSDSTDPFIELDAYKVFNFSRRGSLSLTGSSGYEEAGENAASLGYTTYYQAGAKLNYQILKRLSSNAFSTFRFDEFHEDLVNRKDKEFNIGGGLSWTALKWLMFNLNYTFTNFDTDADDRGDYKENSIFFSVNFIPSTPIRPDYTPSRQSLENDLFNR